MKMRSFVVMFAVLVISGELAAVDVLHLRGGKTVQGQIEGITHRTVTFRVIVNLGGGNKGQVKRSYWLKNVEFIDFFRSENEIAVLAQGRRPLRAELQKLWGLKGVYLDQPRSNAGEIGLLYAEALLLEDSVYYWSQAMELYGLIEQKSWHEEDRRAARLGQIRGLVVQGKLDEAKKTAKEELVRTSNEEMIIEVWFLLGKIGFLQLKALQENHPRWQEDEEIRPQHEQLYHEILDCFLNTCLFHGTQEESAARGLMVAAEVYHFAGDFKSMQESLQDVVQIYPLTSMAVQAAEKLEKTAASKDN